MKNFLVFGGTLEGRSLSEWMSLMGWNHTVCVATEYGGEVLEPREGVSIRQGRMNEEEMIRFLAEGDYLAVVDATHPYAVEVSKNIRKACSAAGIPCIRLLRDTQGEEREDGLIYVGDSREAASLLEKRQGKIFLSTGSKELSVYVNGLSDPSRLFVRVLPSAEVVESCRKLGLEGKQICAMQGPFSREINEAMLRQVGASYLVTKDTGKTGGFPEKLQAAAAVGVQVVVIRRPGEEGDSLEEVKQELLHLWDQPSLEKAKKTETAGGAKRRICCIGIGMGDLGTLTGQARQEILTAQILFGAERMLKAAGSLLEREGRGAALVCEYRGEKIREYLKLHPEYERVGILFSGDVGFYSGARGIRELFPQDQVEYVCGISSVVYFASKIPTSWQDAKLYSIHGKPGNVVGQIQRCQKMLVLVSGPRDVEKICAALAESRMEVRVTVGSNLAYPQERIQRGIPKDFLTCETKGLHIMLLENEKPQKSWMPGLPDEAFQRGRVPMTKEEIRILSLAKLQLEPDSVVFDVGAGTGSVSVECALLCPEGDVYAIERNPQGICLIEENAKAHGAVNVTAVEGTAPEALEGLPTPTHAFIGGSSGNLKEILLWLREKNPQVRIVMNMITLESVGEAVSLIKELEIENEEIVQISASKAKKAGRYHLMTALNPVYVISFGGKAKERGEEACICQD